MAVRKSVGDLISQYPNIELAGEASGSDLGCTECKHTMYIPCFDHPYCINKESPSYGYHYHSWDVACRYYEEGERIEGFKCYYFKDGDCVGEDEVVCQYEIFD